MAKIFNYIFSSSCTLIFFKNNFNNLIIHQKNFKLYIGIYLIHPIILEVVIKKLNVYNLSKNFLYLILLIFLITFTLSLIILIIIIV